jgi:hypothetical protein
MKLVMAVFIFCAFSIPAAAQEHPNPAPIGPAWFAFLNPIIPSPPSPSPKSKPPAKIVNDKCQHVYELATCYFKSHQWAKVIKTIEGYGGNGRYGSHTSNGEITMEYYQEAIAYRNLGEKSKEAIESFLAYDLNYPKVWVSEPLWRLVRIEYMRSGISQGSPANQSGPPTSSDELSVSANEIGDPCHKEIFDGGPHYHQVTWWYCNSNGSYRKAYVFLNGHLQSTFTP